MGKSAYTSEQAGKTNAWSWNPNGVVIVGHDTPVTEGNRHFFDTRALVTPNDAFIKSVYAHGVKVPITIRKHEGTGYCVTGRRRLLAQRIALKWAIERGDTVKERALGRIKAIESSSRTPKEILTESMVENAHRLDETPVGLGEKMAYARYLGLDTDEIATSANCSSQHVRNMLLIFDKLTDAAKVKLEAGELVLDAALEMCRNMTDKQQVRSLDGIAAAPRGKGKTTAQKASGKPGIKAPKLRFIRQVIANSALYDKHREAILWARGLLPDAEVTFSGVLEVVNKELSEKGGKTVAKKRGRTKDQKAT